MCDTCGCNQPGENVKFTKPGEIENHHNHNHDSNDHHHHHNDTLNQEPHHHDEKQSLKYPHSEGRELVLEHNIMQKNDMLAERNRGFFEAKNIFTLNLVSSPGSGKTSLLEKTITELKQDINFFVIEGDQQTTNDANRINATGIPVIQINTGNGCHLDADMINKAVKKLDVENGAVLIIENVGNLVCPSMFDLGETKRVVVISVTEGEDKPLKYPNMFITSNLCIINKTDLLPYVDFNVAKAKEYAHRINHHLEFIELSVKTGEGMNEWYKWLKKNK